MKENVDNVSEVDSLEELPPPMVDDEVTEEEVSPPVQVESESKVVPPDDSSTWKTKRTPSESPSRISKKRAEENAPARNKTVTSSYATSSRSSSSSVKSVAKSIRSPSGSSSIPRMSHSTLKKKGSDNPPSSEGTADESVADFVQLEREIEKESRVSNGSSSISKRPSHKTNIPSPSTGSSRKTFESSIKSSTSTTTAKATPAEQRRPLRKVETRTASGG